MAVSKRKKADVVATEVAEKHTLIIAEKPRSAEKLAQSLADGNIEKSKGGKASWFEFTRNGKKHIVVPAVGHLFSLRQVGKGWKYPIFDMEWAPIFEVSKSAGFAEDYYKNILKVAKGADDVIVACDYDVEGDVIAFNIIKFICARETAKRMKFSTLTKQDLVESYDNQLKSMDMLQVEAGLARHQLDWLWGLNSTRALTLAYKAATNRFKILSSGRVQGPALAILSNKEKEIGAFVPKPFWEVGAEIDVNGTMILASYSNGRLWNKSEAEVLVGKEAELKELR
ncbi:MAG: DNA topoisomerase I, partial [Candidatus Aenigmarchaeota archaeon]|nr:DNA topoisomerase I [Candidatus Aenigmarchaeota archaeon]